MSGLLHRAAEYRANQRNLRLVKAEATDGFDELGGTPEERLEIIEQIDEVINGSQIQIGPDTFTVHARKRGVFLPLLVNLVALILLAVGTFFIFRTLADRESDVVSQTTVVASTEGRLLRQLREDSDARLSAKDSEIAGIENRLARISAEREEIENSVNAQLTSQEEALRLEFDSALSAERERLQGGGLSEAEVARQLEEFQALRQGEFSVQLEAIRAQAQQELQDREAELNALVADAEQSLADAESERALLEADFRDEELRLTAEFAEREAALTEDRAAAIDQLAELQSLQEQEQLVLDQIVAFYAGIQNDLTAGNFDGALGRTDALREYLSDGPAAELPTVQRRRRVELFLVESLEKRITDEQAVANPDASVLAESATVVATVTELIAAANGAYGASEFENARTLYLAALSEIPAVRVGYDRLVELEQQAAASESARVESLVLSGNSLYRAGSYQDAASAYGEALATLPAADTGLLSRVLDAGYQLQTTNDLAALRSVQAELEAAVQRVTLRETELEELRSQLAELQSQLSEERLQLSAQQELLTSSESQLAQSQETAQTLRTRIAALQSQLDTVTPVTEADPAQARQISELEATLVSLNQEILEREDQIVALESALSDRALAITAQTEQIATLQSSLADRESANSIQTERIAALESDLLDSSTANTAQTQRIAALESDLLDSSTANTAQTERIAALQAALDSTDGASSIQSDRIAELESALGEREIEILTQFEQIEGLESALSDRDRAVLEQIEQITNLQALLSARDTEVTESATQIDRLHSSVEDLSTRLADSQTESEQLREEALSFSDMVAFYGEKRDLADEIIRYQRRFATPANTQDDPAAVATSLELLETKLLILRIIGSDSVQSQFPDLANDLNDYLDALVEEQRVAASEATLAQVNEVLEFLLDDAVTVLATRAGEFPPGLPDTGIEARRFFGFLNELVGPDQ